MGVKLPITVVVDQHDALTAVALHVMQKLGIESAYCSNVTVTKQNGAYSFSVTLEPPK